MWNVTRRESSHMESLNSDVSEICPKTGDRIAPVELPKKMVIKRFFGMNKNLPHPLDKYKAMGTKNMSTEQLDSAYSIIKGLLCKTA